jgi:glycosyltransferase involved in cell wall biosynthesis
MKVTLVGPVYPYRGGIAHYNALLAQALADEKHSVRLISFRRQYPSRLYPGDSDKDPSLEPLSYPSEYLLDPLFPWTWLHAARTIRADLPDLVVFHWWTTFWAPAFASLAWLIRRKVKVAFLIHNVLPHEAKVWDRWMARMTLRQGQAFIVQAPHEHERLMTLIPSTSQVIDTPLPPFLPFHKKLLSKAEARQQLGLPTNKPILLFFGIVRLYKGLKYLVDSLAHIERPAHLVIAGEFWEDITVYRQQIETLALSDNITLLNRYIPNEEAHLLFSAADGLVAPYVGGTQSGAAGLALGYGLPMIVTDRVAAGLPAGLSDGQKTGDGSAPYYGYTLVVPAGDPIAMAKAIDILINKLPTLTPIPFAAAEDWSRLVKALEQIGQEHP